MSFAHLAGRLAVAAVLLAGLAVTPTLAVDTGGGGEAATTGPSLADARTLIRAERWKPAVTMLKAIVANDARNADALNLLGFSLRKSGDTQHAEDFYLKALKLEPGHKGANEYLGELYVETGHLDKAKAQLAILQKLCGNTSCEEYEDLEKAIAGAS